MECTSLSADQARRAMDDKGRVLFSELRKKRTRCTDGSRSLIATETSGAQVLESIVCSDFVDDCEIRNIVTVCKKKRGYLSSSNTYASVAVGKPV